MNNLKDDGKGKTFGPMRGQRCKNVRPQNSS